MLLGQIPDDPFISFERPHGGSLILTHEAAVTYRVGAKYGSEFAFETFFGHGIAYGELNHHYCEAGLIFQDIRLLKYLGTAGTLRNFNRHGKISQ